MLGSLALSSHNAARVPADPGTGMVDRVEGVEPAAGRRLVLLLDLPNVGESRPRGGQAAPQEGTTTTFDLRGWIYMIE